MNRVSRAVPRIGLIMPLASQQGGAERLFQNLLRSPSRRLEYKVLFLQNGPLVDEARMLGYEVTVLKTTHLRDVRNYLSTIHATYRWIKESQLDLVFSWMLKAHFYVAPAAMWRGTRRMWFQHGIAKRHWMDLAGAALPADGILCCSEYVQRTQNARWPRHVTYTCHPGIYSYVQPPQAKTAARERLGVWQSAQVVCMVARLERWKGAHVFIEAARLLALQCPNAIFCVVGGAHPLDPDYAKEIQRLQEKSGLGDRLKLLGQLPADLVSQWQVAADVIVHPVTEPEPFGMAVVEALATGRAVVASRAGGISEIIEDGISGLLLPPGDAAAFANEIHRLLTDVSAREHIEAAARVRSTQFSVEAFTARFESLVLSVFFAKETRHVSASASADRASLPAE